MPYKVLATKEGGMGRIWLLERLYSNSWLHPVYKTRIAVKTFDFVNDSSLVESELNHWIGLDNPNIVPLLKIARLNFQVAAVMPMMQGSLADLLVERTTLPEKEVACISALIAVALDYALNKHGLLHLDLKPGNVLYNAGSILEPKVSDWGISRLSSVQLEHALAARSGSVVFN